ncbi:13927_t:CDS:2 [Entrophospora sp. SA101]|nr:15459_t:CDS:2 [Entrophospora sp. SA101]CAJ0865648.1 13927_t:CDS:2 [Entrophospora sp. SA101]
MKEVRQELTKEYCAINPHFEEELVKDLVERIWDDSIAIDYLPNVHGSAVFARGETKVLSVITIGKISDKQLVDSIFNRSYKHFIHHYNFPPFAVNEIASYRTVSRREIGHGELAEKTFDYLIPPANSFPYTVRAVSEVLSSDGSSSQASICATSLSLMTAGVPLIRPAAGIALGLFEGQIYSDINGLEDKLGEMDFKIAGTEKGICSLQLDVKNQGISQELIKNSFVKARQARLYLLEEMKKNIYQPRPNLSAQVIKCRRFAVAKEKIGLIIGPRGKTINQLTEETGSTIEVQADGYILIYHQEEDELEKTYQAIKNIIKSGENNPDSLLYKIKESKKLFQETKKGDKQFVSADIFAEFKLAVKEEIIDILKASGKILNEEGRLKNENSLKFLQKIIGSTDLASELDQVEVYYDSGQKYGVEEFDDEENDRIIVENYENKGQVIKRIIDPCKEKREEVEKEINKKQKFKGFLKEAENLNYQREINHSLPENPTFLQVAKYKLCKKILGYKLGNKLTRKQVADKIGLSKAETENILFCEIEKFTLDRLMTYTSQLFAPFQIEVNITGNKLFMPTLFKLIEEK